MNRDLSLRVALAEARQAILAADDARAASLLGDCDAWPGELAEAGVLAKAELLLASTPVEAIAWLSSVASLVVSDAGRFEYNLLSARAFASVRNAATAAARLTAAEAFAASAPDGEARAALFRARLRWHASAADADDVDIQRALGASDPNVRALAYLQRSWIHAAHEDYASQLRDVSSALAVVDATDPNAHVRTRAMAIFVLARLAFECADATAIARAQAAYDALAWTDAVLVERYQALRAFGWDAFMRGAAGRAQWIFREASLAAPSDAWRAQMHLDRAYVARVEGNEAWALGELFEAEAIAQRFAWADTTHGERLTLVHFAEMFAPVDSARALRYASMFTAMGLDGVNPNLSASRDRRHWADERYAFGVIEKTIGNRAAAESALNDAHAYYESIAHHYRAGLAATALADVTGDPSWTARAVAHIAHYPGSPLAGHVAVPTAEKGDPLFETLTPMQRQVARGMIEGLDAKKLSTRFSRSLYTIQHEMQAVYGAFGVSTLNALRDAALKRGIR